MNKGKKESSYSRKPERRLNGKIVRKGQEEKGLPSSSMKGIAGGQQPMVGCAGKTIHGWTIIDEGGKEKDRGRGEEYYC